MSLLEPEWEMATTTFLGVIRAADMACMCESLCQPHEIPSRKNLWWASMATAPEPPKPKKSIRLARARAWMDRPTIPGSRMSRVVLMAITLAFKTLRMRAAASSPETTSSWMFFISGTRSWAR